LLWIFSLETLHKIIIRKIKQLEFVENCAYILENIGSKAQKQNLLGTMKYKKISTSQQIQVVLHLCLIFPSRREILVFKLILDKR